MKKRCLTIAAIVSTVLGISLLYNQSTNAGTKVTDKPFQQFKLEDYDFNKNLSQDDLAKEISAYSRNVVERIKYCADTENPNSASNNDEKTKDNINYFNYCPDIHASDYIRLNYLFSVNARQKLSPEVLNFVTSSDELGDEPTGAESTAGMVNFDKTKNVAFITNYAGMTFENVWPAIGSNDSFIRTVIRSLQACVTDGRGGSQSAKEEKRKVYINKDAADAKWTEKQAGCKKEISDEYGDPIPDKSLQTCDNIEKELISTTYDVKIETEIDNIYYSSDGACANNCNELSYSDCIPNTENGDFDLNNCLPTREPTPRYYKKSPNSQYNLEACNECLGKQLPQRDSDCVRSKSQEESLRKQLKACDEIYEKPPKPDGPTCLTPINILNTTSSIWRTKDILNSAGTVEAGPRWLPLTDREKHLMDYGSDGADMNDNNITLTKAEDSICAGTGFKALICVIVRFFGTVSDGVFGLLESMLMISPRFFVVGGKVSAAPGWQAWNSFRVVANLTLAVLASLLILAQITSYKPEIYNLKKTIPTFVAAAILINLSYYICQIAADLSNLLGFSLKGLIDSVAKSELDVTARSSLGLADKTASLLAGAAGGALIAGVVVVASLAVGLSVLVPIIIGVLSSSIMVLLLLAFRQLIVLVAVFISPVAFALIAFPATQNLFNKWSKVFISALMAYPIIAVMFGTGKLAYRVVSSIDGGFIMSSFAILLLILPLFLIPSILGRAMKSMPLLGGKIQGLISGASQSSRQKVMNTGFMQGIKKSEDHKKQLDKLGLSNPSFWSNPWRATRSQFNRKVTNRLPIYSAARGSSKLDPERWQNIQDGSKFFDRTEAEEYVKQVADGNTHGLSKPFDPDTLMSAIIMTTSQGDSNHETIARALDFAKNNYGLEGAYIDAIMTTAMNNYISENILEEVAMFRLHHSMVTRSGERPVFGFSNNYEDFQNSFDENARRSAITTEFLRMSAGQSAKFPDYQNVNVNDPNTPLNRRLAREIIEGKYDQNGRQISPGLFQTNKAWRSTLNGVKNKSGLRYVQYLNEKFLI